MVQHRQYRTSAQKRESADGMLREHPDWSDERISDRCIVSVSLVYSRRKALIAQKAIPTVAQRLGRNGKTYDIVSVAGTSEGAVRLLSNAALVYSLTRVRAFYILDASMGTEVRHIAQLTSDQAARLMAQGSELLEREIPEE